MAEADLYPRHAAPHLVEALQDSPVVLIHGPRQCGKTTLARMTGEPRGYVYISFDDDVVREAAATDPAGFVADLPEHVILDEVQRAPAIFAALKMAVDRRRTAGRFLLTGSSQVLLVPKLTDSLAGRMARYCTTVRCVCVSGKDSTRYLYACCGSTRRRRRDNPPAIRISRVASAPGTAFSIDSGPYPLSWTVAGCLPLALADRPSRDGAIWISDNTARARLMAT